MLEREKHEYEKAILVGVVTQQQSEEKLTEYLDELEFLAYTAGATIHKRFSQKMQKPNPKKVLGFGF
ncbi:GTPase HflX, partial [Nonlabens mediterrranea]|nr:GTPase HflX [Nonlabens mediterrranea]